MSLESEVARRSAEAPTTIDLTQPEQDAWVRSVAEEMLGHASSADELVRLDREEGQRAAVAVVFDRDVFGEGLATAATATSGTRAPAGAGRLATMFLLAILGGLILNAMPCVLPVLSLKVFGLIKNAGMGRAAVVTGGLATSAGPRPNRDGRRQAAGTKRRSQRLRHTGACSR